MASQKFYKYMKQYEERNYAPRERKWEKSDLKKYSDRNKIWKSPETSRGNSIQCCREEPKEEIETAIQTYGKVVLLTEDVIYIGDKNESIREENASEAYQERRQGIQESDQGRCKTEERDIKTKGKKMKKDMKEKKHEAKESKAFEKKEEKKEKKSKK